MHSLTPVAQWKQEEQASLNFKGWDFSYLEGRMIEESPPWSYTARVRELLAEADSVLDLGTGGGERLHALRAAWPQTVAATEPYPPNLQLAKERLEPHGATVVYAGADLTSPIPFDDASFDLVISRHSSWNSAEVHRVLKPNGTFFTQQYDGRTYSDLIAAFGTAPQWPYATLDFFSQKLIEAGLSVTTHQDWTGSATFTDVAAIVYYLHAVPWFVPGFSVDTHLPHLQALQTQLENAAPLTFTPAKYILEAIKP